MSRPRETDRASERLTARATLDRVSPAMTALRIAVHDGDNALSRVEAEAALCAVFEDIEFIRGDAAAMSALADAAADPAAAAMLTYVKAARKSTNAAAVRTSVEQMARVAENEQAKALLDLIVAATRSPKIPTYVEELLDELLAAGLTNGLTAAQREAIVAILGDPNFGRNKKIAAAPVAAVGPQPVIAASWTSLPHPVPGFIFKREKVHQNVLNRAVLDAGLPPATTIDFFVPGGSLELANIEGDRAKAVFVWKSVKTWLAESGTSVLRLDSHRQSAWVFLLGHVHGFLPGVSKIDKVTFASPWAPDEVIHATRVVEQAAEV